MTCKVSVLPSRSLNMTLLRIMGEEYGGGLTAGVTERVKKIVSPYLTLYHGPKSAKRAYLHLVPHKRRDWC